MMRRERRLKPVDQRVAAVVNVDGKSFVDFSTNDYLGLRDHPQLIEAMTSTAKMQGVGATGSRLLSGDHILFHQLEAEIAQFLGYPTALFFNSGYQMNVGLIPAIVSRGDAIFSDRFSHASLIDGALLSGAKLFRFRHNDMADLERQLIKHRPLFKRALIVTESLFSMEGDFVPLESLVALKEKYKSQLLIDEAHAVGIWGPDGRGIVAEKKKARHVDFLTGTFGKAFGSAGAFVACDTATKADLISTVRSFIYSTASPLPIVAANRASLALMPAMAERREIVKARAAALRRQVQEVGMAVLGQSQIVPIVLGSDEKTMAVANALSEAGIRVLPIRPPTVPEGASRLRISVTALHSERNLSDIIQVLQKNGA